MFKTKAKRLTTEELMFAYVFDAITKAKIIEIICPICGEGSRVEPTSNEKDTWVCCECGMEFEVEE